MELIEIVMIVRDTRAFAHALNSALYFRLLLELLHLNCLVAEVLLVNST